MNLDGTSYKPVVQHESDNVFYASPRFDATGNVLYFHRRAAIIQAGSFVGNEDSLERLDLRTGERKRLVMNGADPALSPDGKLIVYVHLTQGQPDGLWIANVDGLEPATLLQDEGHVVVPPGSALRADRLRDRVLGGRHACRACPPAPVARARRAARRISTSRRT